MKDKKDTKVPKDTLGNIEKAYFGYSSDGSIRKDAASGGIVSTLLIHLLEQKKIDGALVTKSVIKDGKVDYNVFIAKTPEEVLSARGSVYFDVPLLKSLPMIKEFNGKLAVVGLPCHIKNLRALMAKDKKLASKIGLLIGLFCTHSSKRSLLDSWFKRKKIKESEVARFIFRRGHWRGKTLVHLKNQIKKEYPYLDYGTYQILYFHVCERCLACGDQTAEYADISCGDVWLKSYKENPIKHSNILARNKKGLDVIEDLRKKGLISAKEVDSETVYKAHKRALVFHKNVSAREKAGKLFGMKIKAEERFKVRWNDYLAAVIVLMNSRLSKNKFMNKMIFIMPKFILKLYMYAFKVLSYF